MKKILIVEDDLKIALAVGVRLKANGYEVLTAFDAMAGVAMAVKHVPDLVILDISIPAGSGFLVAERLQSMTPTFGTPIIFMTGSRNPEFQAKAMKLGAVAFMEKPFQNGELIAQVRKALGEEPAPPMSAPPMSAPPMSAPPMPAAVLAPGESEALKLGA